jgi:ribA/ribD-fused uncharacterized protein
MLIYKYRRWLQAAKPGITAIAVVCAASAQHEEIRRGTRQRPKGKGTKMAENTGNIDQEDDGECAVSPDLGSTKNDWALKDSQPEATTPVIDSFGEKHSFLSNFFRHKDKIFYDYEYWVTAEHAYQAAKSFNPKDKAAIFGCKTPGDAKRRGKRVKMRIGWGQSKRGVMLEIIRAKFKNPQLRGLLLATGDAELIEGNTHGDKYWGVCGGEGENHLGQILMQVREEIRTEEE